MKDVREQTLIDLEKTSEEKIREVILDVYESLEERGYKAQNQLVGYITSGDPAYIPRYNDARIKITQYDRDEILNELLSYYIKK